MATLQLQVDIDSEAHPELYAALSAIGNASLRPERLRHLAAGGLIWEHLRAQPRLDAVGGAALAETVRAADGSTLGRTRAHTRSFSPVDLAPAAEEPPVLHDVVDMAAVQSGPRTRAAPEPRAAAAATMPADESSAKRSGPRSRLLLMKERGLFKNG